MRGLEGHITFRSLERTVFELIVGKYELGRMSWNFHDINVHAPNDNEEESFVLVEVEGTVTSFEAEQCALTARNVPKKITQQPRNEPKKRITQQPTCGRHRERRLRLRRGRQVM